MEDFRDPALQPERTSSELISSSTTTTGCLWTKSQSFHSPSLPSSAGTRSTTGPYATQHLATATQSHPIPCDATTNRSADKPLPPEPISTATASTKQALLQQNKQEVTWQKSTQKLTKNNIKDNSRKPISRRTVQRRKARYLKRAEIDKNTLLKQKLIHTERHCLSNYGFMADPNQTIKKTSTQISVKILQPKSDSQRT